MLIPSFKSAFYPAEKTTESSLTEQTYFPDFKNPCAREVLTRAANKGKHVLIFGSSELTNTQDPFIPYRFLNDQHIPTVAFGHAGNQSLAILAELASRPVSYKNSQLVIMLSPGWFEAQYSSGTSIVNFLDNVNEYDLQQIAFNKRVPHETVDYISQYLFKNLPVINNPSSVMRYMAYNAAISNSKTGFVYSPFAYLHGRYSAFKYSNDYVPTHTTPACSPPKKTDLGEIPDINWNALTDSITREFLKTCTNNNMGIRNEYYTEWVQGKPAKKLAAVNAPNNQEFHDYNRLIEYLTSTQCDVHFVMMPLHPHTHENLTILKPMLDEVKKIALSNGFSYYDMMVYDTAKYEKGILSDIMHLGSAGWLRVNQSVVQQFKKTK